MPVEGKEVVVYKIIIVEVQKGNEDFHFSVRLFYHSMKIFLVLSHYLSLFTALLLNQGKIVWVWFCMLKVICAAF